jgi:hypothetical protein
VDAVLTALSRLSSEQLVEPEPARAALASGAQEVRLELFDRAIPPVTLRFGAACPGAPDPALVLWLGGPAPAPTGARYARVEAGGASRVYVVSQGVASELDVPFEKFRETRLLEYGRSELAKIVLGAGPDQVELEQRDPGAFFVRTGGASQLASREAVDAVLTALSRLSSEQLVEPELARAALASGAQEVRLEVFDRAIPPVTLRFGATCPGAPDQALVLREQSGRGPRAGCIPTEVRTALAVRPEDARLAGPFAARVDEVEELAIRRGSEKLDLARKDRAFVLRGGATSTDVPLDAGNEKIAAILRARGTPTTTPFEPAGEVVIQISGADEATHRQERISFGPLRPDGSLCVKRAADGVAFCVDADSARAFAPDSTSLRSLAVLRFAASELVSLESVAPGATQRLRRRDDGSYELTAPKGYLHDGALVTTLVQTLGSLEASRWVGDREEPRFGFASPRLRLVFELSGGASPRELTVGGATQGGYFAKLAPEPGVFVLASSTFAELSALLVDRALTPFPEETLARAELKVGRGRPRALSAALLASVAALRAERTVHLGPRRPHESLDAPQLELTLTATDGRAARVTVGACETLDDASICYARLEGVDATFALSRRLVAELRDFAEDAP